jgi:GNAT superfamily N-acetyltransferase
MRAAIRAIRAQDHTRRELSAWASLPPLYHRWAMGPGGEAYLVAERGRRILGYAARRGGELTAVFVRPRAQGQGVGRALVRAACSSGARDGHESIRVLAARAAAGFYVAVGFRAGSRTRVPLPDGLSLAAVRMRRALRRRE